LEKKGFEVIPNAKATFLTMNRIAIREMAARELGIRTARYEYAESEQELKAKIDECVGLPCVVKPVMSSSGKGQSIIRTEDQISEAWSYACTGMRGDLKKVIVEEFIHFESEITLLTIRQRQGETLFVRPIGHRQERGDYQESWMPAEMSHDQIEIAQKIAQKITDKLGGFGLFGVEFFLTKNEVIFNELSPRPHDTGMVTLISQNLSEFDLHARAILGLPIPSIRYHSQAAASSVILANEESLNFSYHGLEKALAISDVELRIFGKPSTRKFRRMGVALATAPTIQQAIEKAIIASKQVSIHSENEK
jgi:phosphoribosylglycinamide formyltransferase 2